MIKIYIGETGKRPHLPFRLPQSWEEVTAKQASELAKTTKEDLRKRLTILGKVPGPDHLPLSPSAVLAAYEIISFVENIPDLVPDELGISDPKAWVEQEWTYLEFEVARKTIIRHKDEISMAMYEVAEIKDLGHNYLEAGAKGMDGIAAVIQQYDQLGVFNEEEPTVEELAAGVEELQQFGVYPMISQIAERYGKYPQDIEQKPAGWVMQEYAYQFKHNKVQASLSKMKK